jgi:protoheme IX farnesyltransferase
MKNFDVIARSEATRQSRLLKRKIPVALRLLLPGLPRSLRSLAMTSSTYLELTKPRLTSLVIFTTWLGFALASHPMRYGGLFFHTVAGSWLVAAGAAVLNQYIERDLDAKMRRTMNRPLPQHRLLPPEALRFGVFLCAVGAIELAFCVNLLTCALSLLTLFSYLFVYTPLKTRTSLCTLVGAIPGAIPPVMGWTAAAGHLAPQAWVLFAILFLWQLPHFLAIAWMYREDYARAGFPMLPVVDPQGGSTARMILLYTVVLIPVTLMPARMGVAGLSYFCGALALGTAFLVCGAFTAIHRTAMNARRLLLASVIYLPSLLTWMACNKTV